MTAYADGSLYYYAPNKGACVAFAALFLVSACAHVYQLFRHQCSRLTLFLPWGTSILAAGYAMRAAGAWDYQNLDYFIAQYVLLLAGPPVYGACLYVVLGRLLYYIPWLSPIHPGRVVTTFIGLDLLCEVLIGTGAPRASNSSLSHTEHQVGLALVKAGMVLQCALFIGFLALAAHFHAKCRRAGVAHKVNRPLTLLYGTGSLILERSILRTVEMFQGYTGSIYTSEPLFWVLEASVMLVVSAALNIWHPASLLPSSYKIYLATDGVTERLGPGWVDRRPFLLTLVDPFDLASLFGGKYAQTKFWEEGDDESKQGGVVTDGNRSV